MSAADVAEACSTANAASRAFPVSATTCGELEASDDPQAAFAHRLFCLPRRPYRRNAGGGARQAGCFRVHGRYWRKFRADSERNLRRSWPGWASRSIADANAKHSHLISRPESRVAGLCTTDRRRTDDRPAHMALLSRKQHESSKIREGVMTIAIPVYPETKVPSKGAKA